MPASKGRANYRECLDLIARLFEEMAHAGTLHRVRYKEQTGQWLRQLEAHPAYLAACKRRQKEYWNSLETASTHVDK